MAQDNTKLCDLANTNNNDFLSTPIAPLAETESCDINAALLNLGMKDQFAGLPSEDVATHLNSFVDLCDMQKKKDVDNAKAEASLKVSREACSRALEEAREADRRREAAEKRAWELQAWSASLEQQVEACKAALRR